MVETLEIAFGQTIYPREFHAKTVFLVLNVLLKHPLP